MEQSSQRQPSGCARASGLLLLWIGGFGTLGFALRATTHAGLEVWMLLVGGVLCLASGVGITGGREWGRWLGVLLFAVATAFLLAQVPGAAEEARRICDAHDARGCVSATLGQLMWFGSAGAMALALVGLALRWRPR